MMTSDLPAVPVTIKQLGPEFTIPEKRVNFPVKISWTCPRCNKHHVDDYSKDKYIDFPRMNSVQANTVYCNSCGFEGEFRYIIDVTFRLVE